MRRGYDIGPDGRYDHNLVMTPAMCRLVDFTTRRAQYYNQCAEEPDIEWYNAGANGAVGLFYAQKNLICLKRDRQNTETHSTLIHELGHFMDYQINPQTFFEANKRDCELRAWTQGEALLIASNGLIGTPLGVETLYLSRADNYRNSDCHIGIERGAA